MRWGLCVSLGTCGGQISPGPLEGKKASREALGQLPRLIALSGDVDIGALKVFFFFGAPIPSRKQAHLSVSEDPSNNLRCSRYQD
jgi:hypothetical protein